MLCDKAAYNVDLLCDVISSSTDMKYSFLIFFLNSQKANVYSLPEAVLTECVWSPEDSLKKDIAYVKAFFVLQKEW